MGVELSQYFCPAYPEDQVCMSLLKLILCRYVSIYQMLFFVYGQYIENVVYFCRFMRCKLFSEMSPIMELSQI